MDLVLEMSTNHGEATTLRQILISEKLSPLKLFLFSVLSVKDDPGHIIRYILPITSLATSRLLVK